MSMTSLFPESIDILGKIHYHDLVQIFIISSVAWFVLKRLASQREQRPSDDEVARKLEDFNPEPLISTPIKDHPALKPKLVTSRMGKFVTVNDKKCLNLATHNYLNLVENKEIEDTAIAAVNKYGVGSCGPRGFYGTVDVHLELEEKLAEFMETEKAVVYSYGFSTIASAISAYCKRQDFVFYDEKINFAIQQGLAASKSQIVPFKHNNFTDLKSLLSSLETLSQKKGKSFPKNARRFLIVEGIYMNTGQICPLPELVELCRQFKVRIFIDESISFGTLGAHGRGVTEHFGIPRHEIDLIMASLEWSVGSIGGFCVGSTFIIEHQILSGLGYCFSASSPPLLTAAATTAINIMTNQPNLFAKLHDVCALFHKCLPELKRFYTESCMESPVKHLYLRDTLDREVEEKILTSISDKCFQNNLAIIKPAYLNAEKQLPLPSLRICLNADLNQSDIEFALNTLNKCAEEVFANLC